MLLAFLQRIFKFDTRTDLERYVASKYPQSAADVDHIMRVWYYKNQGGWL
jgi:hypothetical protein